MTEDELNRLVLERARKQVEQRKAERQNVIVEQPRLRRAAMPSDDRPALWGFIGLLLTLVIGALVLIPGAFADKLGWVVHGVCSKEHTLTLGGTVMPLCQRNTGIYAGFLATVLTLFALGRSHAAKLPPRPIWLLLLFNVVWMGIDGFNSLFLDMGIWHPYTPQPVLRILSGLAMGMSMGIMLLFAFNLTVRADARRDQPIVGSWRDIGIIAAIELLLFVLIQLAGSIIAYPLAIFSTIGILLVMFSVNVMLVSMVTRYEGSITKLAQLARPGMVALILTAVEFGALAWGRIVLERSLGIS